MVVKRGIAREKIELLRLLLFLQHREWGVVQCKLIY